MPKATTPSYAQYLRPVSSTASLQIYATGDTGESRYYQYTRMVELPQHNLRIQTRSSYTYPGVFLGYGMGDVGGSVISMATDAGATRPNPAFYFCGIDDGLTIEWPVDSYSVESIGLYGMGPASFIKNSAAAGTRTLGTAYCVAWAPTIRADTGTLSLADTKAIFNTPAFNVINAGVGSISGIGCMGLHNAGSFNTGWTIPIWAAVYMAKPTGTGGSGTTIAGVYLVDIEDSRFTNKYSLYSAGANVHLVHAGRMRLGDTTTPTARLELTSTGSVSRQFNQEVTGTLTSTFSMIRAGNGGVTVGSSGSFKILEASGTWTMSASPGTGAFNLFGISATITGGNGISPTSSWPFVGFGCLPTFRADAGTWTANDFGSIPGLSAFASSPTFSIINAGVNTIASWAAVYASGTVNTGTTITNWYAMKIVAPTGSGTITNRYSIFCSDSSAVMEHAGAGVFASSSAPTNSSVGLEVQSTTKALLVPRMTTTQKNALTAVDGMIVYDSTLNQMHGYINGSWTSM